MPNVLEMGGGIVGKSDFASGILILGSTFPNFPEYFSKFSRVFFRIFPCIFPNFPKYFSEFSVFFRIFSPKLSEDLFFFRSHFYFSEFSKVFFRIFSIFPIFFAIFPNFFAILKNFNEKLRKNA